MGESLVNFHLGIIFLYLTYYFKFSERSKIFFDEIYDYTSQIKSSITGEIANRFTKELKPIPDIYITNSSNSVNYKEGIPNPAKGEKFKNWLDDYLADQTTFFVHYYQVIELYKSWKWTWSTLKYSALVLTIIELLLFMITFYWSNICPEPLSKMEEYPLFCSSSGNDYLIFNSTLFSGLCLMFNISLLIRTEIIYAKLRGIKDKDAGF